MGHDTSDKKPEALKKAKQARLPDCFAVFVLFGNPALVGFKGKPTGIQPSWVGVKHINEGGFPSVWLR